MPKKYEILSCLQFCCGRVEADVELGVFNAPLFRILVVLEFVVVLVERELGIPVFTGDVVPLAELTNDVSKTNNPGLVGTKLPTRISSREVTI